MPGGSCCQLASSLCGRRDDSLPQWFGEPSILGKGGAKRLDQRISCVHRGAAEDAGVQVALAGPHRHMEVGNPAGADVERGQVAADHPTVKDHGRVGVPVVGVEKVDDPVAAGLLLAVAGEAHVDR